MSTPLSQDEEIKPITDFLKFDLQYPKAAITAIDNLGKFEIDDFVGRLKYQSQDIARILVKVCQQMDKHPRFQGRYACPRPPNWPAGPQAPTWADTNVDTVVVPSSSSSRWIRDQAATYLDAAFDVTWEMTDAEGHVFQVSYPKLKISKSIEQQTRNVADWLEKLSEHMPDVETVVCAGLLTAWDDDWWQGHTFAVLVPDFPEWIPNTPLDVLRIMNVHRINYYTNDLVPFIKAIADHLVTLTPVLTEFLDLFSQPENKFGSEAQLIPLRSDQFKDKRMFGITDTQVKEIKRGAVGRTVSKVKNKGLVVAGLLFGFSSKVEVSDNYLAQVNGDPNNLRIQYLKSDFKTT